MSAEVGIWGTAGALALAGSLWVGGALPGGDYSAAPDGVGRTPGTLLGPGCDRVAAKQARIASAALITDEILLELLPLQRWESVSYVVDHPRVTPVSGRFAPGLFRTTGTAEQLFHLNADRFLLSEYNNAATLPHLASGGRCVIQVAVSRTVDELLSSILWVGRVTGTEHRARALHGRLARQVARWPSPPEAARPRALILQGLMTYGPGTLQHDCLRRAGLHSVIEELRLKGAPHLSSETLLRVQADVLFVAAAVEQPGPAAASQLPAGVLWDKTYVAQKGQIIAVPDTWVGSLSHHALRAGEAFAEVARRWQHAASCGAVPGRAEAE
jgi:iron complex transport system substrate-binding protein